MPVLILSGGEPLLRADIFEISTRAKAMGFYVGLSSNGTLIDAAKSPTASRDVGYDYVGISLDGHRRHARPVPPHATVPSTPRCAASGCCASAASRLACASP